MRIRIFSDPEIEISASDRAAESAGHVMHEYIEEECDKHSGFHSKMPSGMQRYLDTHGWHFSRKLHDYATASMKKKDAAGMPVNVQPLTKDQVDSFLSQHGIELENDAGYDACYVANMARSDYYGSSILTDLTLAKFVRDYIDDPDGYEGLPLMRYYADCIGKGLLLPWEEMI